MKSMDKLDYLIINELLLDAQISFLAMSKKLGTSPHTIKKRYDKMKKEGVFGKFIVSIDLSKIGYQGKAFFLITNAPNQDKAETISELKKIKNIISITEIVGAFDILAIAPISDVDSVFNIVKKIKALPGVKQVEITAIKDTAFPINPNFGKTLAEKFLSQAPQKNQTT